MQRFRAGLESGWGVRELPVLLEAAPPAAVRILAARHGMAKNNDLRGVFSCFNRDACLNDVGWAQAQAVGAALEQLNVGGSFDLVVVSPFTRALQTASAILGKHTNKVPTLVQPLCAEHTLLRSAVQRGDRGRTADELERAFPKAEFPQYDFEPLKRYCTDRGLEAGKWWAHSAGEWHETRTGFSSRCSEFKQWLAHECMQRGAKRVLLVSHGGTLKECFGLRSVQNAECRAVDIFHDGVFSLPASPAGPAIPQGKQVRAASWDSYDVSDSDCESIADSNSCSSWSTPCTSLSDRWSWSERLSRSDRTSTKCSEADLLASASATTRNSWGPEPLAPCFESLTPPSSWSKA